jgi:hypothetical protein
MGRHAIVEKLAIHLSRPVRKPADAEPHVVYLLVELRKLLEHDNAKEKYPVLNFHSNWVVHTTLSQSEIAEKIIRHFDELPNLLENVQDGQLPIPAEMERFLNQDALRKELDECLQSYGLPTKVCSSQKDWLMFSDALCRVIEDCPLKIQSPSTKPAKPPKEKKPTQYVESVTVSRIPDVPNDGIGMEWKLKFHTRPRVHVKDGRFSHLPAPPRT